jgi:hypothetical protein
MECFGEISLTILEGAVEGTILLPPIIPAVEHAAWEVHVDEQEKITYYDILHVDSDRGSALVHII